jgi:hypothetical protein
VGVVDSPLFYSECDPIERHVARRTPHLRAPANLEDHLAAPGTGLGVLLEELDRLDVVRVTYVVLTVGNLIALLADVVLTDLALPPR